MNKPKLTRVSFAGIDAHTDLNAMVALSKKYYPKVPTEWAYLVAPRLAAAGRPRYMGNALINSQLAWLDDKNIRLSIHFCEETVQRWEDMDPTYLAMTRHHNVEAIQLNTLTLPTNIDKILRTSLLSSCHVYVQWQGRVLPSFAPTIGVLVDSSRGHGTHPARWDVSVGQDMALPVGFAGGLGPGFIKPAMEAIEKDNAEHGLSRYYLDMETRIRDHSTDRFSLDLCEQVLQEVSETLV